MKKAYIMPRVEILNMDVVNSFMDTVSVSKGEEVVDNSEDVLSKDNGDWGW